MSIYYSQRVKPLKALYDKIEEVSLKHIQISYFDAGDLQEGVYDNMTYPAAYLETISEIQDNGVSETYSISLNILDRKPQDATKEQVIATHDNLKQVFEQIHGYLSQKKVFGTAKGGSSMGVGAASMLLFNDFEDTRLVRLRADFTITVEGLKTPEADYASIFRNG